MENLILNQLSGADGSQIASTAAFAVNSGSSSAPTSNPRVLGVDLGAVVSGSVRPSLPDQADELAESGKTSNDTQERRMWRRNEQPAPFVGKKFMSAQQLEELALTDPMRARRIRANRESAAKSKEKKMRYMKELEKKLNDFQVQDSTFCAQFAMLESDAEVLSMKNKELRLQLQFMKEQAQRHDDLNNSLREEVWRLKIMTGQLPSQ